MLKYALFDLGKPVMISVEYLTGLIHFYRVCGHIIPRQFQEKLEVVALNGVLGNLRIHALQLTQFAVE